MTEYRALCWPMLLTASLPPSLPACLSVLSVCLPVCLSVMLQEAFSVQKKLHTLDRLAWSDMFETFLANK